MDRYINYSQDELEARLVELNEALDNGGPITGASSGDVSVTRTAEFKADLRSKIAEVLRALYRLSPTDYPAAMALQNTVNRVSFS